MKFYKPFKNEKIYESEDHLFRVAYSDDKRKWAVLRFKDNEWLPTDIWGVKSKREAIEWLEDSNYYEYAYGKSEDK